MSDAISLEVIDHWNQRIIVCYEGKLYALHDHDYRTSIGSFVCVSLEKLNWEVVQIVTRDGDICYEYLMVKNLLNLQIKDVSGLYFTNSNANITGALLNTGNPYLCNWTT